MSARGCLALSALLIASTVNAQQEAECDDEKGWWNWRSGPGGRACVVRELTLPARDGLAVDAGPNGSIRVTGENRRDVQVRAIVQAWAQSDDEAARIASAVDVRSDGGVLQAEGPDQRGRANWSVSYRVLAPRNIDLTLETQNGGIEIAAVRGDLDLEAQNGGIRLDGVAGDVR